MRLEVGWIQLTKDVHDAGQMQMHLTKLVVSCLGAPQPIGVPISAKLHQCSLLILKPILCHDLFGSVCLQNWLNRILKVRMKGAPLVHSAISMPDFVYYGIMAHGHYNLCTIFLDMVQPKIHRGSTELHPCYSIYLPWSRRLAHLKRSTSWSCGDDIPSRPLPVMWGRLFNFNRCNSFCWWRRLWTPTSKEKKKTRYTITWQNIRTTYSLFTKIRINKLLFKLNFDDLMTFKNGVTLNSGAQFSNVLLFSKITFTFIVSIHFARSTHHEICLFVFSWPICC